MNARVLSYLLSKKTWGSFLGPLRFKKFRPLNDCLRSDVNRRQKVLSLVNMVGGAAPSSQTWLTFAMLKVYFLSLCMSFLMSSTLLLSRFAWYLVAFIVAFSGSTSQYTMPFYTPPNTKHFEGANQISKLVWSLFWF